MTVDGSSGEPIGTPSRRLFLKGSAAAVGLAVAAGGLALPEKAAAVTPLPWAKRIWGYLRASDATMLRYSVMLPAATGRFPVAMQYHGYDAGTIGGSAYQQGLTWLSKDVDTTLLQAGYAVMGLSMRGTGCSGGLFNLYGPEWGTDGALGVEWAAAQPWSTGHVGMYDWSWAGIGQLFAASRRPRGLAAIAPGMAPTDPVRDLGAPGGVVNPQFPVLWWATIQQSWTYDATNAAGDGDTVGVANVARNLALGQESSPVASLAHPFIDDFWSQRDLRSQTKNITAPILSMQAWQDEEVGSRAGYYQDLVNPKTTWFVGTNGQHDTYVNNAFRLQLVSFLDHFVKGKKNGFDKTPHVQLWMETASVGAPTASDADLETAKPAWIIGLPTWPLPVKAITLYLQPGGALTDHAPAVAAAPLAYVATPGPSVNDGLLAAVSGESLGSISEAPWTSYTPPVGTYLSFTTAPFVQTATISGSASLNLWLSSLSVDTDVQATVTEVRPDGYEQYVQRGWLRASERALDPALSSTLRPVHTQTLATQSLLTPSVPTAMRVEINPFTHTFRKGSALRVIIDAPSGTGDWNFAALLGAHNQLWCDPSHVSTLVVGLLSTVSAPTALPATNTLIGEPCRANRMPVPTGPVFRWPSKTPPST